MTTNEPALRLNWSYTICITLCLTAGAITWSYWPTFLDLADEWSKNPLYSHGYLVPAFAATLLWLRREHMPRLPLHPSWWALPVLLIASVLRLGAAYYYFSWPDRGSLLFLIFGIALAIGGGAAARWAWPSILFLTFMIPFPGFVENAVMKPLQKVATLASTNVLQTLGFFAQADGNVIVLSEVEMGIVEACSGLRMLSTFVALTVGACFLLKRPAWQKCVIAISAFPIAVVCNVARISSTGVLYEVGDRQFAEFVFHDVAGWLMMPLALLLLLLELKILDMIFIVEPTPENLATPTGTPAPVPPLRLQNFSRV